MRSAFRGLILRTTVGSDMGHTQGC
jgi:hypothetical protein